MVLLVGVREICLSFLLTIGYMGVCVEVGIPHRGLRHHNGAYIYRAYSPQLARELNQ